MVCIVCYSVHDQTILFTRPEDHGECSRPHQNDRPSAQTTASETYHAYRVQRKIAEEQPRIGPTSNAIGGPVVLELNILCCLDFLDRSI
jgi:hypothetical protein